MKLFGFGKRASKLTEESKIAAKDPQSIILKADHIKLGDETKKKKGKEDRPKKQKKDKKISSKAYESSLPKAFQMP